MNQMDVLNMFPCETMRLKRFLAVACRVGSDSLNGVGPITSILTWKLDDMLR